MILFKLTRTSKGFFKNLDGFWQNYFVFLLACMERSYLSAIMKNLDDLRSRQILEALIDEFAGYERN